MPIKINLLVKKEQKETLKKIKKFVFSGTFLFLTNLVILGSSLYAYWRILSRQANLLEETAQFYQGQISAFADVEEKKSLLTVRLKEIEKIYQQRVDFVQAIEGLEKLFGENLKIDSLTLNSDGEAVIITKETGALTVNPQKNIPKEISTLQLNLISSDSAELANFIQNLQLMANQGLTKATLVSLKRTEKGNYEFGLKLEMTGIKEL